MFPQQWHLFVITVISSCALAQAASAADLVVRVTGLSSPTGQVGCSLHQNEASFPSGSDGIANQWQKVNANTATCRFKNVKPGTYAVAVFHDENGNGKLDSNLVGIPSEPWGVSNNVRPSLKAPGFEESSFQVKETGSTTIDVKLAK